MQTIQTREVEEAAGQRCLWPAEIKQVTGDVHGDSIVDMHKGCHARKMRPIPLTKLTLPVEEGHIIQHPSTEVVHLRTMSALHTSSLCTSGAAGARLSSVQIPFSTWILDS